MICDRWDTVVVPFPFTDKSAAKRRPAMVLSSKTFNRHGHAVLCMITSASHSPWPGDTPLLSYASAGLNLPCLIRLKIFTLDNRVILKKVGSLSAADRKRCASNARKYLL